ncbi:MAG: hypothetical protein ACRC02_15440 [Vogesella sp.]|uniref:hypothetical protein n=1 Tax=Vogesella sp. TaxID=1904252 RepID=UPI003F2DDA55
MEYENRICCFIDVLGFKSAIEDSCSQPEIRDRLYELIAELPQDIRDSLVRMLPFYSFGEADISFDERKRLVFENTSFELTQFSDCFVMSAKSDDVIGCDFLLRAIYLITVDFFFDIGLMTRGGVSSGLLIHKANGVLFGPAMNYAYGLESKFAIYPRVIFSQGAISALKSLLANNPVLSPLKNGFDGYDYCDLVSVFDWDYVAQMDSMDGLGNVDDQIDAVMQDVLRAEKMAYPKIAYLKSRWQEKKNGK